jgi:hypothetical protein
MGRLNTNCRSHRNLPTCCPHYLTLQRTLIPQTTLRKRIPKQRNDMFRLWENGDIYIYTHTHTHNLVTYIDTFTLNTAVTSLRNEAPTYPWKQMAVTSPMLFSHKEKYYMRQITKTCPIPIKWRFYECCILLVTVVINHNVAVWWKISTKTKIVHKMWQTQ